MNIAVIGIGGIGGTIGGFIAKNREASDEVYFVERTGAHFDAIAANGLTLETETEGVFQAKPTKTVCRVEDIGKTVDLVIVCCKAYSLQEVSRMLSPIVGEKTVVLPILNGVNTALRIRQNLNRGIIVDGCTYLTGMIKAPGVVDHRGTSRKIFFGADGNEEYQYAVEQKLRQCGLDAKFSRDVVRLVWSKYVMVCSFGVCTAYFDANVGEILNSPKKLAVLRDVILEIGAVAKAMNIDLGDCYATCIRDAKTLNPTNTSSLKRDLDRQDGSPTELGLFSPYICELGKQYGVATPVNAMLGDALSKR